ncbi:MAG: cation:proton antiporter, partial [Bacteroidales bacterium]|nr:cation:proton antiporter [Bacteroidales bacterium]
MEGNLELVYDLAVIFITAGIITLIFKILKQPLILGYIVAGLLVGPHLGLFPHAIGAESVEQWSEIGIIFLLFGLGLEFSFKKLLNVGSSALITAGTIFVGMFVTSMGLGKLIGWTNMECIFLGGMLSMSSTTIIIKAFDDLGMKKLPFTEVVFGTLVVEDLLAVILMVLLSTMAVSQKFAGGEMLWALLKLLFFIVLWFLVGMFVIPSLLKWGRKFFNDEMLTVLSIGLCFGMAIIANSVGFSSALGAFIMGSMLSETIEGERIENLTSGIKDLFGAVFFISVGMLVNPQVIIRFWKPILILIVVVLTILPFFATTGVLLSGKGLHSSIRAGFSFAQIGEFAFIIASLGSSLGVISEFIYPVIVAVSVITTLTTPYYMKMAEPLSIWLSKKLPQNILSRLTPAVSTNKTPAKKSEWKQLLTMYGIRVVTYSVLLIAIYTASDIYLKNFITEYLPAASKLTINFICAGITLATMSPFIIGLIMSTGKQQEL